METLNPMITPLPDDPTHQPDAINPNAKLSPAPSKETIAREAAAELLQIDGVLTTYRCAGVGHGAEEQIAAIILRALDRAGEAKGADAAKGLGETIRLCLEHWKSEIEVEGEKPPQQVHVALLAEILIYGCRRDKVVTRKGQPITPPASVDTGTRTTSQIAVAVAQQFCVCTKQADSTEEYLVSLIEAALNQDRAATNQIIKDDAEELAALTAERDSLAEQLEEAKKDNVALARRFLSRCEELDKDLCARLAANPRLGVAQDE